VRRRLRLTVVLLTVGTLLVSGVVTLLLTVHTTRNQTRREIVGEARSLAVTVGLETAGRHGDPRAVRLRVVLRTLEKPLRLEGSAVVTIGTDGSLRQVGVGQRPAVLPDGLVPADLDVGALRSGPVSGIRGSRIFAAAPFEVTYQFQGQQREAHEAIVLVRRAPSGLATALPWLLASSAILLVIAVIVADRLVRRTVVPLRSVEAVTSRIAAGELSARVEAMPAADAELQRLGTAINAMAEALAAAQNTQRQFLLSVSHELRTPLTSIQGFAEALEDGTATDVPRAAAIIASESRRLARLVSDLLELARLDTGRFSLRPGRVRLSQAVTEAVAAFEPSARDLGLTLVSQVDQADVDVIADPDRLTQVVSNLVENALNHASGAVGVGAARAGGTPAVVWVDDDGPGVAAADLPHVFTRLFSSQERPGRRVGTGLGLAIVADLVGSMGGQVRAESPTGPSGGTRVVVTLPVAPDPSISAGPG
jgi:signal transduction histidine kinase